jgi:hypothetical protein
MASAYQPSDLMSQALPLAYNTTNFREVPKTGRIMRKPSHSFQLRYRPYQIQPCMIAPVWPAETMKNLLLQARVITDPIKSPLLGWWTEYYFFYVKLTDLDDRVALQNMLVTNASTSALNSAAAIPTYHSAGGVNYTQKCLDLITKWYFRDEDETILQGAIDSLPMAKSDSPGWMHSAKDATVAGEQQHEMPGENPSLPVHLASFQAHYDQWEAMRSISLTTATFEDWLESYGIKVPDQDNEDKRRPELIRYARQWAYPSASVDPANGSSANAVNWSVAERADKDRFLKEPGFIVGVTVTRPKAYFSKQKGSLAHYMTDSFSWLPSILSDQAYTGLKKFVGGASGVGPLATNTTNDYWVDIRDLALYGDQFCNFDMAATDAGMVALPQANFNKRYPAAADVDLLFKTAPAQNKISADGRVDLSILGRIEDTTR